MYSIIPIWYLIPAVPTLAYLAFQVFRIINLTPNNVQFQIYKANASFDKSHHPEATKDWIGPNPEFPDGNILELLQGTTVQDAVLGLSKQYGHPPLLRVWAGPVSMVLLLDDTAMHEVLIAKRESFIKGKLFQTLRAYYGDAVFITEGDIWKDHRKALNPAFRTDNILANMLI